MTYFGNSVPKIYTTQEITNQFSFVYTIVKSLYIVQDGSYLVGFGMVGLFCFGMPFKIRTIQNPNNFEPFKIWLNTDLKVCYYLDINYQSYYRLVESLPFEWFHLSYVWYSEYIFVTGLLFWVSSVWLYSNILCYIYITIAFTLLVRIIVQIPYLIWHDWTNLSD